MARNNELQPSNGSAGRPVRVAHLVSHPIQYYAPLYRELGKRSDLDLTVYFYSDASLHEFEDKEFGKRIKWDVPLTEGYKFKFCRSASDRGMDRPFRAKPNWDLLWEVFRERYDLIWVHGYGHVNAWLARLVAMASGARYAIREDQTLLAERPWHKRAAKQVLLRTLFKDCLALYSGDQNRRYFANYGVAEKRLFPARHCVDNRFFRSKALELSAQRQKLRLQFGISGEEPVILFCGKFIDEKQPLLLLEAFEQVRRRAPCRLLMAGSGPLLSEIEGLVRDRGIPDVILPGFMNQTELPRAYACSDILVLPSVRETWGLVVNEAMNFGLPVIVSDRVGCAEDLVRPGWNGFVFPHKDTDALAESLTHLLDNKSMCREFGARSASMISGYTVENCADQIAKACLVAVLGEESYENTEHNKHARSCLWRPC